MITYKGTPMLSTRDFIETADRLDTEFGDALREFLPEVDAICDENDDLLYENREYQNKVEQLERQIQHYEVLKIGIVMKENEELRASMQQIYDMLKNTKGVESIMRVRLKKALDYMKEKGAK